MPTFESVRVAAIQATPVVLDADASVVRTPSARSMPYRRAEVLRN